MGQPLMCRPLYDLRQEEESLPDGRLNTLALCLLEGLGVRREVVGALSALEVNDPLEKVVVCRLELSAVLLVKGPRHSPVKPDAHLLDL